MTKKPDTSDDRIRAMLRGRREVRVVPFPGMADQESPPEIGVRILLEEELDRARIDAVQYVNGRAKDVRLRADEWLSIDAEILDREIKRCIVLRAFVEPHAGGDPKPFFRSPTEVRQLDSVMLECLFHIYLDHQNYVSPLLGVEQAEVTALVDALGKEQGALALLSLYDAPTLRSFVRTLASRLQPS